MSAASLPHLRQELQILDAPRGQTGSPRWFIFDPVRNAFHLIEKKGLALLRHWKAGSMEGMKSEIEANAPDLGIEDVDILAMSDFLYANQLTIEPPSGDSSKLADREAAKRRPFYELIIHKYLFFRIPLFAPDRFLRATYPFIAPLFSKITLYLTALIGVVGIYFALGQWDQFTRTFWHFFTLEGIAFYVLALIVIKSLHELGHAFIAHHYGARVPTLGVAFMVMFPILFTDTTDAWRLKSRKERLMIDGGGILIELMIACVSIFLWAFLPDGPMRSLAFFAATTSWAFSLLVNLNPCMRFDGYYIFSDLFGFENLQKTGFAMGRWRMRETLFGLGRPVPEHVSPTRMTGLLTYAYSTWIYRFFLFIGIALLVHHMFPKAIGIILFVIEILFFIVRPIWSELKQWWSFRMEIIQAKRGRASLILFALTLALLFWPFQTNIAAPARIEPVTFTDVYPAASARVDQVFVKNDQEVKEGDVMFTLSSTSLDFDIATTHANIKLLDAQIARRGANLQERQAGTVLDDERKREVSRLKGLLTQRAELKILAPQDGIISAIPRDLHAGRHISQSQKLATLSGQNEARMLALAPETQAEKISDGAAVKFFADDAGIKPMKSVLSYRAPTALSTINQAELTSNYGGKIAVHPNSEEGLTPVNPVYQVEASLELPEDYKGRTITGLARIKGPRESYAKRLSRQILRVLIREGDF